MVSKSEPAPSSIHAGARPEARTRTAARGHFPEYFFSATVAVLVLTEIIASHRALNFERPNWNLSEWMINYSDGFVRRGLGGAWIAGIMRITGLGFYPVWITF